MNEANINDKIEATDRWRDDNACWLDGQPAKIVGWKRDFPMVAQLDGPLAVEYAWATVNRIMDRDRRFSTK